MRAITVIPPILSVNLCREYIVAEETLSLGAGNADAWVLKLDGIGSISGGCPGVTISPSGAKAVSAGFSKGTQQVTGSANAAPNSTCASPIDSMVVRNIQCSFP